MSLHTIRLYLEPNPGGVYTVTSPDVPGLVTEGQTPDEVQANVQEALDALVESWAELGRDRPPRIRACQIGRQ
jgi:antitoxin HicB